MKKLIIIAMSMILSVSVMAQQKIQLRSADKAECVKSDMRGLKASFSFSTIEAQDYASERGTFSWLSLPNTVIGGNEGDPQIPVVNELIAVPFGAQPRIEITSFSTTDYRLDDYGIHTLVPRQPSLRKDQRPEDVPFIYNESAYQTRGFRSEPVAVVNVDGTMRGIQVGKMTIEPVSYDPVNNTLRVFNDIEVEVHFDGADTQATEEMLVKTYSPYFDIVYAQLFNEGLVRDVYSQHPDLYTTPVKMIVITTSTYTNNTTFQNWVKWKKQKGIYTTVYTTATTGTSASSIKTFIRNQYNSDAPTFVVIVGDKGDVAASLSSSTTNKVTDLYYSSTSDSDLYPEMYLSRMPVSSTTELSNLLNKTLMYEQYTMSNSSYLNETLLIAGWDSSATEQIGSPTIQYANNYYFNSSHGITPHVFLTTASGQTTCYNFINQVGFVNYTAHGDNTMWADPQFTTSNVSSMTNNGKYFWAMGNCCLAANWGYSGTCLAEAMLRAANKGAWGYIGSCPETYWYEDYYFGVGATNIFGQMPTQAQTKTGCYDAMFNDSGFNTLNSVPFIGNLAVAYAHAGSYYSSTSDKYYWEAYHCLGDGSVMPYLKNPSANNVSHADLIPLGATTFTVSAVAGSYVSITVNDEIIGVAQVPSSGTVNVPIIAQTIPGTAHIVVTRQQRQPYCADIPLVGDVHFPVTAFANPTAGGSVIGAGDFDYGTLATLTAIANEGYTFTNWTRNGLVVGTEAMYSFTVTEAVTLAANFALNSYIVTATPNTVDGGSVTISGNRDREEYFFDFEDGTLQGWTTLQGPNGDSPNGWMHSAVYDEAGEGHNASDGFVLSESYVTDGTGSVHPDNYLVSPQIWLGGSISFWATNMDDNYAEHFGVAVSTTGNADAGDFTTVQEWTLGGKAMRTGRTRNIDNGIWYEYTVDLSAFRGRGYVAIRHFDCYDQWLLCVDDITLVPYTGTVNGIFNHGETCTVTATANEGYAFVNWTEGDEIVSTDAAYSFVVTDERELVANFEESLVDQSINLSAGWSWWSTNLDITLDQLKAAIAAAVGVNGTASIKSLDGAITYRNGQWRGTAVQTLDIRQMYEIQTGVSCEITLTGAPVNPVNYEITINHGANWIGYLHSMSMTLGEVFGTFPADGDIVKSSDKSSVYRNGQWRGQLTELEPGHGYIYESNVTGIRTFVY